MKGNTLLFIALAAVAAGYFLLKHLANPYGLPSDVLYNLRNAVPGSNFLMLSADGKTYKGIVSLDHYLDNMQVV